MIFPFQEQELFSAGITNNPDELTFRFPFGPVTRGEVSVVMSGRRLIEDTSSKDPGSQEPTFKDVPLTRTDIANLLISVSEGETTLASGHARLKFDFQPAATSGDTPPTLTLTVACTAKVPPPKPGEEDRPLFALTLSLRYFGARFVKSKEIPLDLINRKLDQLINIPQPISVHFENRKVGEIRTPNGITPIFHAFAVPRLARELDLVYDPEDVDVTSASGGKVLAMNLKDPSSFTVRAVTVEGEIAFKVRIAFPNNPGSVTIHKILDLELSLSRLELSVYLVIRHDGFQVIPVPQQSAFIGEGDFDQLLVNVAVGSGLEKLYQAVLIGPYLQYVMTWFTGDERIRAIGAIDDVAELLTLEDPPPPRVVTDLLLFSSSAHVAGYFSADGDVDVLFPKQASVWTRSWTHVVGGNFSAHDTSDVAVYDSVSGTLEFHVSDGKGGFTLLRRHDRLRPNWTLVIAGNFGGSFTGLLFYDRAQGVGEFYSTDGQGGITLLKRHTGWRRSWAQIVPGNFGGDQFTDLLFYDPAAGTGEFYSTDGQGGIRLLRQHTSFRKTWTLIISGNIAGDIESFADFPSLLFYDASANTGEFWATDGLGGMRLVKRHVGWRSSWEKIVLGGFAGSTRLGLLFYERGTGFAEIYNVDRDGNISGLRQFTGWRTDWGHIVAGRFGGEGILRAPMTIPAADVKVLSDNIDHIVVLMLENRSFDHMLGYLTAQGGRTDVHGLTGRESNPMEPRLRAPAKVVFPLSLSSPAVQTRDGFPPKVTRFLYDPAHGHMPQRYQRGGYEIAALPPGFHLPQPGALDDPPPPPPPNFPVGPMEGFVIEHRERLDRRYPELTLDEIDVLKGEIMGYYTSPFVKVYDHLARHALICDHWHAAIPGETWPNRFVTLTGVLSRDEHGRFAPDNPDSAVSFDPIETLTILDHLTAAGRTWRYYEHDFAFLRLFSKYTFDQTNIQPIDQFFKDAAAGTLPDVSFIEPDLIDVSDDIHQANDDHPPADIEHGQELVGRIFNALRSGPKWGRTLFVLTYDEHGGFYDHVFPDVEPALAPLFAWPEIHVVGGFLPPKRPEGFDVPVRFRGMRVPTFIISPHVAPGQATHTLFDHTTIIKTIVARFLSTRPPDMGPRVAQAPTLAPVLTPNAALNVPPIPQTVLKSTHATPLGGLGAPADTGRSEEFHFVLKKLRARVMQTRP